MHGYDVFMRRRADTFMSQHDEVVFDLAEVPFLSQKDLRTAVVTKMKMSDDHSHVAFTLDISNTEVLTGGVKDLTTGKVLPLTLKNVGQLEFASSNHTVFFTECDPSTNRPHKVKWMNILTGEAIEIL